MKWDDDIKRLEVEANAETPRDNKQVCDFGGEGIDLDRTKHIFFAPK